MSTTAVEASPRRVSATDLAKVAGADNPDYLVGQSDLTQYDAAGTAIGAAMATLVKGAGFRNTAKPTRFGSPGNTPTEDDNQVFGMAMRAEKAWKAAITKGFTDPVGVVDSWNPHFNMTFPAMSAMFKSFTTTSPLATGLAPFNLAAP
jgi:hypothetical protein